MVHEPQVCNSSIFKLLIFYLALLHLYVLTYCCHCLYSPFIISVIFSYNHAIILLAITCFCQQSQDIHDCWHCVQRSSDNFCIVFLFLEALIFFLFYYVYRNDINMNIDGLVTGSSSRTPTPSCFAVTPNHAEKPKKFNGLNLKR